MFKHGKLINKFSNIKKNSHIFQLLSFQKYHFTNNNSNFNLFTYKKEILPDNLDVRKSFNINKDHLVLKSKSEAPESFLIYSTNYKVYSCVLLVAFLITANALYFIYNVVYSNSKERVKRIPLLAFTNTIAVIFAYSFLSRYVKRIQVSSLKNNRIKVYLPFRTLEGDFDMLRFGSKNTTLYFKDKQLYLHNKRVHINSNEDLALTILKGYKIKVI
jgi:hypothetical protein